MPNPPSSLVLSVRGLNVSFAQAAGEQSVLTDIDFDLYGGEVLALVGESGSGKSLTALSILGLLPANARVSGDIRYAGQSLLAAPESRLRRIRGKRIAMIFQDPRLALDPVFRIGEQIIEALLTHSQALSRAAARARALELLELVDIPDAASRIDAYPHELSGGQCQRVMIAMALACEPEILIADEPTTALDATVQKEILQVLRRLRQRIPIAILLITHDMGVVAESADRVIVLRRGRIEEITDVAALFHQPQSAYTRELLAAIPRYRRHAPTSASSLPTLAQVTGLCVEYRRRRHGGGVRFR